MVILTRIRQRGQIFYTGILSKIGINVKFSPHVLTKIDSAIESGGYSSRSEFILEAVLMHLDRSARIDDIRTFLCSEEGRSLIREILDE